MSLMVVRLLFLDINPSSPISDFKSILPCYSPVQLILQMLLSSTHAPHSCVIHPENRPLDLLHSHPIHLYVSLFAKALT